MYSCISRVLKKFGSRIWYFLFIVKPQTVREFIFFAKKKIHLLFSTFRNSLSYIIIYCLKFSLKKRTLLPTEFNRCAMSFQVTTCARYLLRMANKEITEEYIGRGRVQKGIKAVCTLFCSCIFTDNMYLHTLVYRAIQAATRRFRLYDMRE